VKIDVWHVKKHSSIVGLVKKKCGFGEIAAISSVDPMLRTSSVGKFWGELAYSSARATPSAKRWR
jgi:hypothetical protein